MQIKLARLMFGIAMLCLALGLFQRPLRAMCESFDLAVFMFPTYPLFWLLELEEFFPSRTLPEHDIREVFSVLLGLITFCLAYAISGYFFVLLIRLAWRKTQ